jgi:hypothetical protein
VRFSIGKQAVIGIVSLLKDVASWLFYWATPKLANPQ